MHGRIKLRHSERRELGAAAIVLIIGGAASIIVFLALPLILGGCTVERPSRGQQIIDGMRPAIFGPQVLP